MLLNLVPREEYQVSSSPRLQSTHNAGHSGRCLVIPLEPVLGTQECTFCLCFKIFLRRVHILSDNTGLEVGVFIVDALLNLAGKVLSARGVAILRLASGLDVFG